MKTSAKKIYRVIARIPRGRVATYGQVATLAGLPRRARLVGAVLRDLPDTIAVPWHRVLGASGRVSPRAAEEMFGPAGQGPQASRQRCLLEEEGIRFDGRGRVDLDRYLWDAPANRARDRQ